MPATYNRAARQAERQLGAQAPGGLGAMLGGGGGGMRTGASTSMAAPGKKKKGGGGGGDEPQPPTGYEDIFPGTGELDPFGYPTGGKSKFPFKGHQFLNRMNRSMPPWAIAGQGMFPQALGTLQDILGRQGATSPEALLREQAGIEQGRGQAQQALATRAAQAGIDPSSPQFQAMAGTVDQGANRLQANARREEDMQREQRMREDLNLVIPWLQAMMSWTTKKGGGGISAAPVGGGGGGTDWAGLGAGLAGNVLGGWAQSGFAH